jgi:outer membrane biosynthesis protein TonB
MTRKPIVLALGALACVLAATAAAAGARIVAPDHLPSYWRLTNDTVEADMPNTGRNMTKPGCAAVSYTIGSDGVTRDIRLRKLIPASDLGSVAVSIIKDFHYAPAPQNSAGVPVSTYYIVQFNMPADPAARERLTRACDLPGYGTD